VGNTEQKTWCWARPAARGIAASADQPRGVAQSRGPSEWRRRGKSKARRLAAAYLPWGLLAKGYRTRHRKKISNRFILVRRDGRP